jgi:hypothetical protein
MALELTPRMTADEIACFLRHLQDAQVYLEFGCGGSTRLAAESGVAKLLSVDTDREWIKRCRKHPAIAPLVAEGRATLRWVNVGSIAKWGYPANEEHAKSWPDYSLAIWTEIGEGLPDVVLIDGRWRVSTTVQALLRCRAGTIMMFHDFPLRQSYAQILPFIDVLEQIDTLLVFRRKPETSLLDLADLGFRTLMIPR